MLQVKPSAAGPTRQPLTIPTQRVPASAAARLSVAPRSARALSVTKLRLRRVRQRYRYSLTTIDVMFAAVAEPIEVQRAREARDRRTALYVLISGLIVLIAASVGAAVVVRQLIALLSTFMA